MNKQALSLAIFIAGAYPAASSALGLGDIESNSHLNQPLRAKIDLLSAAPADASQIQVRLAPPEVFNRVGVARPEFLGNLRFTPTVQSGKPVILVSSDAPIQEPFVNFLLEVSWPQGQLLKEYTVMLDPPVLMQPGNTVAGEAAVRAEPKATGNVRRPAREPAAATATPAAQQPAASRNRTYRVKSGDTLFRVASRLQRAGVSNDQMMMALFRANPGAFIDKNINNLRAGALMKAPSGSEISAVPQAEARRQIRQQNAEWRELRKSLAGNTVPQQGQDTKQAKTTPATQANATPAKAANNATDKARLEVLGAKTGEGTANNAAVAAGTAKLAEIEKQLALANESLAARQNENNELKSRVTDLESMLNKKNRLLELRDSQLADLQKQLAANGINVPSTADTADAQGVGTQPAAVTPEQGKDIQMQMANVNGQDNNTILRTEQPTQPATVLPTETVTKTNTALGQNTSTVATPADTATSNTSAVPLKPAIVPVTPAADAQKAVKEPSPFAEQTSGGDDLLGLLTSPLALKIGAGSLALLLLLWLLGRRRKPDNAASGQAQSRVANLDDDLDVPVADEPFDMNALERELEKADKGNTYGVLAASAKAEEDPFGIGGIGAEPSAEANEDDCLTEANVYIAYGLYQQAETELKKCIERYPDKPEYRHKLMECYFVANNRDAFDSQAQQFAAMPVKGKEALWQSVVEWGRKISPDNRLYQGDMSQAAAIPSVAATVAAALGGVAAATAGVALASSHDSDDTLPVASAAPAMPKAELEEDFNDLDLGDLDFDDIDLDKLLQDEDVADVAADQPLPAAQTPDLSDLTADKAKDETLTADDTFELGELDDDLDFDFDLEALDGASKPQQPQPDVVAVSHNQHDAGNTDDLLDFDLTDVDDNAAVVENPPVVAVEPEMAVASNATHLNLHLDNETGIKRILPKDTFYAPISDEDKDWLGDIDDALSFLDFPDEEIDLHEAHISTKLDLARAYLDMGDIEGARSTLEEVMVEGNDDQRREAEMLLHQTG
ncbi:MAG: FimV/HubP family polar landmark protein [Candidatus Thiothrix putei]|uniref:FimV/HubP family polar landmark protein n=1 Tax=Candidatus Thiothrix putei TaxID=3080811 RepID=A0AA95HET9_9GAMM|nr:MAG: FimV/HubP family polar landmark protein [Candidatus Thiothrix putei]